MERILASRSMARDVFILWDENSEDCAAKRRMRHLRDSCTRSECSLGARPEQGCRQLALHYHFRESLQSGGSNQVHRSDSVQSAAGCSGGVPWGRPSGFVGCNGKAASLPEPPARTFERVPGENSPSLFAA